MSTLVPAGRSSVQDALWRTAAVFRLVGVVYAVALAAYHSSHWVEPLLGWGLLLAMALWSAFVVTRLRRSAPSWPLSIADLVVACLLLASTLLVDAPAQVASGAPTLPGIWVAAPVATLALWRGPRWGILAASVVGIVGVWERGSLASSTVNGVLMLLALGLVVGYLGRVATRAEESLAVASAERAALSERERLGREIHDGVLQALAFVSRRARELGGEATVLADVAAEQEVSLRALVSGVPKTSSPAGEVDLAAALRLEESDAVSVSAPAEPVLLPAARAREVTLVVRELLVNVERHAGPGARVFVLLEDEGDQLLVSVRDDGVGASPERLAEAEAEGRMGLSHSVRGRVASLGGGVTVAAEPGEGFEVEFDVPLRR